MRRKDSCKQSEATHSPARGRGTCSGPIRLRPGQGGERQWDWHCLQIIGSGGEWRISHDGKAENVYQTKEAAFEAAVAAASLALRQGHEVRVSARVRARDRRGKHGLSRKPATWQGHAWADAVGGRLIAPITSGRASMYRHAEHLCQRRRLGNAVDGKGVTGDLGNCSAVQGTHGIHALRNSGAAGGPAGPLAGIFHQMEDRDTREPRPSRPRPCSDAVSLRATRPRRRQAGIFGVLRFSAGRSAG